MTHRFLHTCVESTYEDMLLLEQSEARISMAAFVAKVGVEAFLALGERLGYDAGFPLEDDVHRPRASRGSGPRGRSRMSHSRIEHIYVEASGE